MTTGGALRWRYWCIAKFYTVASKVQEWTNVLRFLTWSNDKILLLSLSPSLSQYCVHGYALALAIISRFIMVTTVIIINMFNQDYRKYGTGLVWCCKFGVEKMNIILLLILNWVDDMTKNKKKKGEGEPHQYKFHLLFPSTKRPLYSVGFCLRISFCEKKPPKKCCHYVK